jgi:TrmH family RNA methyltransferase
MANMGVTSLILCEPRCPLKKEAYAFACDGSDILKNAAVVNSFDELIPRFHTLIGTSARVARRREPIRTPKTVLPFLLKQADEGRAVALIFGPEEAGLDNAILQQCHHVVRIPTLKETSLNLAHAVTIMLYELRCYLLQRKSDGASLPSKARRANAPASNKVVEAMLNQLLEVGQDIQYFKDFNEEKVLWKWRRMFNRTGLTNADVKMIRGFLRQIAWLSSQVSKEEHGPDNEN